MTVFVLDLETRRRKRVFSVFVFAFAIIVGIESVCAVCPAGHRAQLL